MPGTLMTVMAHPDDAEFAAGGLICRWGDAGGKVHILTLTDGSAGHHQLARKELAQRRRQEADRAAALLGATTTVGGEPDGALTASLSAREALIRNIRKVKPSLIVTHRGADYHPDHRATHQLVQDACYLLQVPNIAPDTLPLETIPPVLFSWDAFRNPHPCRADWIVDTTDVLDRVVDALECHASQVYEWLPHTQGLEAPQTDRKPWLKAWYGKRPRRIASEVGAGFDYAEAFEVSEYGGRFAAPDI